MTELDGIALSSFLASIENASLSNSNHSNLCGLLNLGVTLMSFSSNPQAHGHNHTRPVPAKSCFCPRETSTGGFSHTCKGNLANPNNHTARIRRDQSTYILISNLLLGLTEKDLENLSQNAPLGKVALTWVLPGGPGQHHPTAAARLQMFNRGQVQRVVAFINEGHLTIGNMTAMASWHQKLTNDYICLGSC